MRFGKEEANANTGSNMRIPVQQHFELQWLFFHGHNAEGYDAHILLTWLLKSLNKSFAPNMKARRKNSVTIQGNVPVPARFENEPSKIETTFRYCWKECSLSAER